MLCSKSFLFKLSYAILFGVCFIWFGSTDSFLQFFEKREKLTDFMGRTSRHKSILSCN